jgi:hypothetical protein
VAPFNRCPKTPIDFPKRQSEGKERIRRVRNRKRDQVTCLLSWVQITIFVLLW